MELRERISRLVDRHDFDEIRFGLEHTGCYSTHAAMYLQRHLDFGCPDVKVYMFNPPSLIKAFKKSHFLDAPPKMTGLMPGLLRLSLRPVICLILSPGVNR